MPRMDEPRAIRPTRRTMSAPISIALYFIYFEGLIIPISAAMLIYPVTGEVSVFLKFLPFPLLAVAAIVSLSRSSAARTQRRKLFLTLAAVCSVPLAAMIALTADSLLPVPGFGVVGLFPAVVFLEEAHCAKRRRRRRGREQAAGASRGRLR